VRRAGRKRGERVAGLWQVLGEPDLPALVSSVLVRLLLSMLVVLAAELGHQVNRPACAANVASAVRE